MDSDTDEGLLVTPSLSFQHTNLNSIKVSFIKKNNEHLNIQSHHTMYWNRIQKKV